MPQSAPRIKLKDQASLAVSISQGAQQLYGASKEFWRNHFAYSVVVSERDQLYSEVHAWLITALSTEKIRSISVSSSRLSNEVDVGGGTSGSAHKIKPLVIHFNESVARTVNVGGHLVRVSINIPDISESQYREPAPAKIEFVTNSHAGQKAVLKKLEEINAQRATSRNAVLKMVGQWSGWTTRSDLPPRTMASVSLPPEQKERIKKDLATFLDAEDQYNRLAIPWHRGYMFYGPPGTGKTSLVKALANEFNLDLWYVSLSDLKAEASLLTLLADVGSRSLLLLEDIDTMRITHDRDGADQGTISMSSLLNTLDGVATPHGLITVMTTNRFELLDPALTRAGRMDLVEKLDYPTADTISQMYKHFYNVPLRWGKFKAPATSIDGVSTSQIAEIMKRHMGDPKKALTAIISELEKIQKHFS